MNLFRIPVCAAMLGAMLASPAVNAQTKGNVILKATINDLSASGTEHAAVAWVTGPSGFIKTVWKQGNAGFLSTNGDWDHFTTWNTARGTSAAFDGYTSATAANYTAVTSPAPPPPGNNPVYVNWNCKDASNMFAADGTYKFYIQYAEDIDGTYKNGPVTAALSWTKGATKNSPAITSYSNQGTQSLGSGVTNNFTNISVEWKPQDVSVVVAPSSVTEDGSPNLVYTFTRSGDITLALVTNFTVAGSATSGTDYTLSGATSYTYPNGTVTFVAGSATATVTINPTADATVEPDETATLTVVAGTGNYNVGSPSNATGTIATDEVSATVSVAAAPASVTEDGATNLVYTFSRTGATTAALTANFSVGGTAALDDYAQTGAASFTATTGTVTIPIGSSSATVTLNPTADSIVEADETAILTVTTGSGYTVGSPAAATGTITNDDTPYSSWASGLSVAQDGPTQTPQGDGVTNLEKFAFNLNPLAPDVRHLTIGAGALTESAGLPAGAKVGGALRIEFLRRKFVSAANPGITYKPQFSSSLGTWVDFTGTESVSPAADPAWERVTVDDGTVGTARFGRVKVEQNP